MTLLFGAAFLAATKNRGNRPIVLPGGSSLRLVGITVGTNAFLWGTKIERVLGNLIPPRGLHWRGFSLNKPILARPIGPRVENSSLVVWVNFRTRSNAANFFANYPGPLRDFRLFAANSSGRQIENPTKLFPNIVNQTGGLVGIPLTAFPRDEKEILLRLYHWDSKVRWNRDEWRVANPMPAKAANWTPQRLPATNRLEGSEIALADVTIEKEIFHGRVVPRGARFYFKLARLGPLPANWTIDDCLIQDAEGNFLRTSRRSVNKKEVWTDSAWAEADQSLEIDRVWKVELTLVQSEGFTDDQMLQFRIGAGQSQQLTNASGKVFSCLFDGSRLEIGELAGRSERQRLAVIDAKDGDGQPRPTDRIEWRTSLGRFTHQSWYFARSASSLEVTLAFPKLVQTDFYVRPSAAEAARESN